MDKETRTKIGRIIDSGFDDELITGEIVDRIINVLPKSEYLCLACSSKVLDDTEEEPKLTASWGEAYNNKKEEK